MPRVIFNATPEFKTWVHRKAGWLVRGDGSKQLVESVVLQNGDEIEMDDFDAQWVRVNVPANFRLVEQVPTYRSKRSRAKEYDPPVPI